MKAIDIKVYITYNSKMVKYIFPSWVAGVTIGNNIYFRDSEDKVSPTLLNHEMIHVCQYADEGIENGIWKKTWADEISKFLYKYLQTSKSYRNKPSEIEAYANEKDLNYIATRWPQYKLEKVINN